MKVTQTLCLSGGNDRNMIIFLAFITILLFIASFICLIIGLVSPSFFAKFFKRNIGKEKTTLIFAGIALGLFVIFLLLAIVSPTYPTQTKTVGEATNVLQKPQPVQKKNIVEMAKAVTPAVSTPTALWQSLKTLDDAIIKDDNIELSQCNMPDVGNPSVTPTLQTKESVEYGYQVSNDQLDKMGQRTDLVKKLSTVQMQDVTSLANWQALKSLDDDVFNHYISQNSWCTTVAGDQSSGDFASTQQDQQSAMADSKELFNLNYKRRDLLKELGYSDKNAQSVLMDGLQY